MDAADFERASAIILDLLRMMTDEQREGMGDRIRDAGFCLKCGDDNHCDGWCDYSSPLCPD